MIGLQLNFGNRQFDAKFNEKGMIEQFKLLQPLFSTNLKQALMSELVGSQLVHLSFSGNASSPDPSARMSLVGDEGLETFGSYPLFNSVRTVLIKQLGAHTGAELPLSQVVALLIERWDYMTLEEQGAVINLLTRSHGRIS